MTNHKEPTTRLDPRYSSEDATATPWPEARAILEQAEVYWLSTVRPEGRPHVTPVISVSLNGSQFFCTGVEERKAKNLQTNLNCVLTTGSTSLSAGFDVVVEGTAALVSDDAQLQQLADEYHRKYGWEFKVDNGAFIGEGGRAVVYEIVPHTAFGFGKGEPFSQTRWRF